MSQKTKSLAYNLIAIWLHPALGGIAVFTLAGLLFNLKADPLAIVFALYILIWCVVTDLLKYFK